MKFRLTTSSGSKSCSVEWAKQLETLGFAFDAPAASALSPLPSCRMRKPTSVPLEICTLEELIAFVDAWGGRIIIEREEDGSLVLEIYDDWRE